MELPDFLRKYRAAAKKCLQQGRVKDIEFSGGTYQVQVFDPADETEVWAFLQLDGRGRIKDCFCSCNEQEEEGSCLHLAAGYLKIFSDYPSPLHQRFERSLWNKLCQIYADRIGDDPSHVAKAGKNRYACASAGGKSVFFIEVHTAEATARLKELLKHRKVETEETSLKFSNLSQEELTLWREGRPSSKLRYELSFWSDLAKWLLELQESGAKYKITFDYSSKKIPNHLVAEFPELTVGFYISEANLPLIIPALAGVHSPLTVHQAPEETIEAINFDKASGCMLLTMKSKGKSTEDVVAKKGIPIGGWTYVPDDGFYVKDRQSLLSTPILEGKAVSELLNSHFQLVKPLLQGVKIQEDPVALSYSISFDARWNLHITAYLFNHGDLTAPHSRYFGDWVYLDDDGFYKVEGMIFNDVETIVPCDDVADFIQQNRAWLNTQEGFQTHIASIEALMTYEVNEENYLSFGRKVALSDKEARSKEFGPWIYVSGQGFYSKVAAHVGLPLRPGIAISPEQIPLFIRTNRDELALIPGFFSEVCPVAKAGLSFELEPNETVCVKPTFDLLPAYKDKSVRFFEDFVYVEGEGFHELPPESRLPERFKHAVYIEKENLPLFLTYELASLRRYASKIDPKLIKPEKITLLTQSIDQLPETPGSYRLKLRYETERGEVPVTSVWHAIKQKKRFYFDEAGFFDLEEKRFNWLRMLSKEQADRRSHALTLSTMELLRLNALEEIHLARGKGEEYARSKQLLDELTQFRIPEEPDLTGLKSSLRPYQTLGVRWLWFLYEHYLSGLLCDDMGLGKTHQTMALMAAIRNKLQRPCHFLVVCPTSVIYHWEEKLKQFLPGARICTFHGSQRSLENFHQEYDILLTSYGIWRIENELLSQVKFELAIFDEIQIAKNNTSRIYSALLKTEARMKLGLTGTPIENRLRELKSLFDIVLPSYMPAETDYREYFIKPIEKEGSRDRRLVLSRLIHPFVLRRRKEDVLLDLPEKIEEISHCELLPDQEKLYKEVLEKSRQKIMQELADDQTPIPYLHIFALLTSLKQICNHPAVYLKQPAKYKEYTSGKWELCQELLNEAMESGQKVVVFSQYLNMIDIFEEYLQEIGVGYATIRGSTTDRAEQVYRFNHDPDCAVFIGSLQASGLGIDLTAGSVVIHYDRWWNAAREDQATDRVHRIGQKRGVQVFKLVTLGTFEEKIDALISRKGQLMEDIVGVDDQQVLKRFSRDEIIQLLQFTEGR